MANTREEKIVLVTEDRSSKAVADVVRGFNGLEGAVQASAKAFGVLAAGYAALDFAQGIRDTIAWEASFVRLSHASGATVESLSSMSTVAKRSGTDMESVASAMQKLSKSMAGLGDEGEGTSKAGKVFDALGISVVDANGKMRSAQNVMQELAGKLTAMKDQTLAVAFAQEVMGRSGANLLPFMHELSEAGTLQAKVTTEQAKAADDFEDSMVELEDQSKKLKISLANDLLPALNEITAAMLRARDAGAGFFEMLYRGAQTALTGTDAHKFNVEFTHAVTQLDAARDRLNESRGLYTQTMAPSDADTVKQDYQRVLAAEAEVARLQAIRDQMNPAKPAGKAGLDVTNPLGAAGGDKDRERLLEADIKGQVAMAEAKLAAAEAEDRALAKITEDHYKREEDLRQEDLKGWIAHAEAKLAAAEKEDLELARIQAEDEARTAKKRADDLRAAEDAARRFGFTMASAFERAVIEGQKFSVVLHGLIKDIAQMALRMSVTEPLARSISGGLTGLFGGTSAGGGSSASLVSPESLAVAAGIQPMASGADYIANDGLAYLHRGERVVTAAENRGGGSNVIHVHFSANTPAASRDAVYEMLPLISRAVRGDMRAERRNTGR